MPKEATKKLEDPRFDNKQDSLDLPFVYTEDQANLNLEYEVLAKFKKLHELMEFFKIDKSDKNAWIHLSMSLAEHYVPGMQFKKRTKPKKWNFLTLSALYCLVETIKTDLPNISRQELFNRVPEKSKNTSLENLVSTNIKPITLEGYYDRFSGTKKCLFLKDLLGDNEGQKEHVCAWFLDPKKQKSLKVLHTYPEAVEKYYIEMVNKAKENNCI